TTSEVLAEALSKENNSVKPVVIYNAFSKRDSRDIKLEKREKDHLSLYWFSQSIGPGRGIEQIIDAINLINEKIDIHLRGIISEEFKKHLQNKLKKDSNHEIIFHTPVPPAELVSTMQEYDMGLSLELKHPSSRDLTVTNKILHYLLAGIPVLASDTAGQKEIAAMSEGAVAIINLEDPQKTADVITNLINDRQRINAMREKAIQVSCHKFNWEEQEKTLLSQVEKALLN
ncbi:MAG: glycosyltransferase, partial [Bacteroidia bacterium]